MKTKKEKTDQHSPETKKQKVFAHLLLHGSITSWEAIQKYGVTRLSGLIYQYKKEGFNIVSKQIPEVGYHCSRYFLIKKGDEL